LDGTFRVRNSWGHSREISNISSAPSATAIQIELPSTISSLTKSPPSPRTELAQAYDAGIHERAAELARAIGENLRRNRVLLQGQNSSADTPSSDRSERTRVDIAVGAELLHYNPSRPPDIALPPAGALPDVPKDPYVLGNSDATYITPNYEDSQFKRGNRIIIDPEASPKDTRQSRQERVRARKARDVAALQERNAKKDSQSDGSDREPAQPLRHTTSPIGSRRRHLSLDELYRRANTLSDIMLVADLAPYTGFVHASDLALPSPPRQRSSPSGTPTPPQSAHDSDCATLRRISSQPRTKSVQPVSPHSSSPRSVESGLDSRRQERRAQRNTMLRERELHARVTRLERDNAMLIKTLGNIAKSFGELSRLLPSMGSPRGKSCTRGDSGSRLEKMEELCSSDSSDQVSPRGVESSMELVSPRRVRDLESAMWDLQGNAGRVSMETMERRGSEYDEFDDDDGESIL
jgi:hypothetical protein